MKRHTLPLFMIAALLLSFAALAISTAYVASTLGYQPQLGPPAVTVSGARLYWPWAWLTWDYEYSAYAPAVFRVARVVTGVTAGATFLPLLLAILVLRQRRPSTSHGSARWASDAELAMAGLLAPPTKNPPPQVVLCQTANARFTPTPGPSGLVWKMSRPGRLVTHGGPEHVMVFAPTRSGKGVGTVIPTLLSWSGSVVAYDIKKELWTLTSGWRRKFSHCLRFEPTSSDSVRFNPLYEIRKGDNEVRDAQNVADILVDPNGSTTTRDHWQATAHTLLVGAILHVLYAEPDKSLRGVATFLSDPSRPLVEALKRMMTMNHLPAGPHPYVAQCAREMLDKSDNELSGVVSTAKTCLALYNDPVIARNTSASDFRIADLMNRDRPVSLYLVMPPSDIDRIRPLIRLLLNQFGRRLTERMDFGPTKAYRHQLLLLLDEFPSLGKLAFFEVQLAFLAGYGIKAMLIAQSLNQLEQAYGQNNAILDNCHVRMTYTANDEKTARRISDLIGQSTHTKRQRSFSGGIFGRVTESEQEHARPLLTPDEILRLPGDEAIVLVGGNPPYKAKKVMHYQDPRFRDRAALPPPGAPREQARELFRMRNPSDWEALPPLSSPALAPVGSPPGYAALAAIPPSIPSGSWLLPPVPQTTASATAPPSWPTALSHANPPAASEGGTPLASSPPAPASLSDGWADLLGSNPGNPTDLTESSPIHSPEATASAGADDEDVPL